MLLRWISALPNSRRSGTSTKSRWASERAAWSQKEESWLSGIWHSFWDVDEIFIFQGPSRLSALFADWTFGYLWYIPLPLEARIRGQYRILHKHNSEMAIDKRWRGSILIPITVLLFIFSIVLVGLCAVASDPYGFNVFAYVPRPRPRYSPRTPSTPPV